jgi:hypothetical protein
MSNLSAVSMIFDNVRATSVHVHDVQSVPIAVVMKTSAQLFQQLDRSDSVQAEFSLRLWILRSAITFTLLPFDAIALDLRSKMDELVRLSSGLPDTAQLVQSLQRALEELLELKVNPKREWMLALVNHGNIDGESPHSALFHALASGKTPGWPAEALPELAQQFSAVQLVGRKSELRSGVFGRIILPCGCQNAPPGLLGEIFHSGRTGRIEALLYPGERLRIPKRLELPVTLPFKGKLQRTVIDHESHSAPIDTWVNEAFWQSIHGAARTTGANRVRAHYTLFCDGTGAFLSSDRRALVLTENEQFSDEGDLRLVRIEDVCEGDLLVLRAGSSGALLDEESDQIMAGLDEQGLVEDATHWKAALEALLLTHSAEEVAQALRARGVSASATSVRQWAGVDALGPGSERVFEALISLLGENGKIAPSQDWKAFAADLWGKLRELRSVRQKAGSAIRQDLLDALRKQFANSKLQLADRTSVYLEGGGATKLLILRVSSIDQVAAFIQPSRLHQLDDLRGNKWLG